FAIAPFVGIIDGRPELTPAPGEVDRVFDVALSELLGPGTHHVERWDRFGAERTMHFFEVDGETVWGATARILAGFLGHLTGVAPVP
ncbi:MAG: CoA pyrophosphatase, partial [Acidimicrobiia bacterium]